MSLYTVTSGLLALKPKVTVEGDVLWARTSLAAQLLTLLSFRREVTVARARRVVEVRTRRLWFLSEWKDIPFDRVHYIDTEFGTLGTSWGSRMTGHERTDQLERYRISLVLKEPHEKVPLFSFMGEGTVSTGWRGVVLGGDRVVDLAGDQDEAFRGYLDLLRDFLGVPIGPPTYHAADFHGRRYRCRDCGKNVPPNRASCLYCGGQIEEVP